MKKLSLEAICAVVLMFVVGVSSPVQADTLEVLPTDDDLRRAIDQYTEWFDSQFATDTTTDTSQEQSILRAD
jgi:hypothetical protein